jgi:hypothetical protein
MGSRGPGYPRRQLLHLPRWKLGPEPVSFPNKISHFLYELLHFLTDVQQSPARPHHLISS